MTGCPIPDSGDPVVVPVCMPDGWQSLISNLLTFPTALEFWDNLTTLEDREVAQRTACDIVGTFNSEECVCDGDCPSGNYYAFDFEQSDGGWAVPSGGYGEYVSSTGWRSEEVEIGGQTYQKLQITIEDFPAWLTIYEVLNGVVALSGTGSAIPIVIDMTAYAPGIGTSFHNRTDLEMTALGTNTQCYLKPSLNVRNVCHTQTDAYTFSFSAGPYDPVTQNAVYTLADLRFWVRLP